ncbi:uncharacterized protein LOC142170190 [Nicotiana tabacum]|uniref:Uncharacterized protein LOC142170190 n=1 Tax=Nicotiana tabacum TaxID=4097 RepID=A0AC58ST46_TOBAC
MSDSTPRKLITRGISTKILTFDGPSFSLKITQGELDAGLAKNMALEKRTKSRHDNFKETQVEKLLKETRLPIAEKRKKHISEASSVKGKEVEASKSSDTSEEKRCEVQHQLFRCFMALQLEGSPDDVFSTHVNGTTLSFSIREFALVTSLKCIRNPADFQFNEKVPNRIIETYFGGTNLVKKKYLLKCFAEKNWGHDNDGDALKIVVLYLIHTFIFSSEKNSTTIPRLHFDLVESGSYSEYSWGIKIFENLTKSICKKMDAQKKYYMIAGMPLAMQVWFYESCSNVDPKIALRVDNVVPRILNWRSTGNQPNFAYLMNGMFNDKGNMVIYNFYCCIPLHIIAAAFIITTAYNCLQGHPSNRYRAVIQIPPIGIVVENSPTPTHLDKSAEDSDDFSPTPDLYLVLNIRIFLAYFSNYFCLAKVVGEFKSLRSLINDNVKMLSDHRQDNQQKESLHQRKETTGRRDDGNSVKLTPIFEKRHPFEDDSITGPHPTLIIQEYEKCVRDGLLARHEQKSNLEDHYKKNKSTLHIPLDFGVDQVNSKNWFYLLSFDDKLWDDNHIDVIFYYLRKKAKYNQTTNFKYTTIDCIFKTRIAEIFDMYADIDSNANVAKEEDVVCEYIRGYRLLANVSWHTVDNVLILVNLKDKLHWILVVVSFKERCIKVYDSYRSAGHDAYVASEIDKLAKLVPLDCGVHVTVYAEFLSTLGEVPQITFDSNLLRQRYGDLLWDYAMRKIDIDAISENEAPLKIARQITESDSKLQIVLE